MRFLTRISIDHLTATKKKLIDSYSWHQALWQSFDSEKRRFLTRIDKIDNGFIAHILSEEAPQPLPWGNWQTREIAPSFLSHANYRFQLRANPTVKRKNDKKNGSRTAIYDEEELKNWINRKAKAGGFEIQSLQITPPINQYFYRKERRGNHKRVDFQGTIKIIDQQSFQETFNKGIGPAKGFGFGMLILDSIN